MRIGLLTTSFPCFEGDSAGHFVHGFADALQQRGHALEVLAPQPGEGQPPCLDGIDLTWVPYMRPRRLSRTFYRAGVPDNLRTDPLAWLGLLPFSVALAATAARRAARWDAVVSHWALPCGVIGAQLGGLPHLCVVHSADMWLLQRLPGRHAIARSMVERTTRMWFVAPHLRAQFEALLPPDSGPHPDWHVGPMGYAPRPLAPGERSTGQHLRVLALGRLVPIKGLDVLVRAVARQPGVTLTIAGAGPERDALRRLARELRIDVVFAGHVQGEAKARLLAEADALALPSRPMRSGRTEGAPTGLIEAMAAGLPIVASDTGGVASMLQDGVHGRIVAPGDIAALSDALARLRDDPDGRTAMGDAAAMHAGQFAWPALAERAEAMLSPKTDGYAGYDPPR